MHSSFPYLPLLVLVPAAAALVVLATPRRARLVVWGIALVAFVGVLGIALAMLVAFRGGDGGYQMVVTQPFATPLGISFTLGVDGISLFLVLLSAVLFPIVLVGAYEREDAKSFVVWLLLLEVGCLGSFLAVDLMMFFLFFETTLVPVYFLIAGWGYERRGYAAVKFFLYTFAGSAVMLVGIVSLVFIHESQTGVTTFDVRALAHTHLSGTAGMLLFLSFTAAFAVKTPIFPFHTWSPDAYREAPSGGVLVLAAVMAKLGTYGIVRFDLGLFPHAVTVIAPLLLTLGVIGIIYGGVVAATQRDLKRLLAYSSLAHMGFIVVGAFALTSEAVSGAVLQMVNHGIYTAALFLLVAMIYRRRATFSIDRLSGLQADAPVLAAVFTVVMLASIGVPGLNGFVGEFLILSGTFLVHRWWAVVATAGVVIAAVYLLWAYQQVFHRSAAATAVGDTRERFAEMTWREGLVLAPLVGLIVFLGVYPQPVLSRITPSVDRLVTHVVTVDHEVGTVERVGIGQVSAVVLAAASLKLPVIDYSAILPELIVLGGALVLLALSAMLPRQFESRTYAALSCGFGIAALIASLFLWHDVKAHGPFLAVAGAINVDGFAVLGLVLSSSIVIVASMLAPDYLERVGIVGCEYYALALISVSGAMFMAAANDLIFIFLALEILSIPLYVMAGYDQRRAASGEAGMKYFVLGAFSSAIFVYGVALTYGATGSTNLANIAGFLSRNVVSSNGVLLGGLALMLVGFCFKVAAVPFHMWTPDVYDGSPTPAVGFMASIAKVGAFMALLRVLLSALPTLRGSFQPALWVIVAITVLLGATVAIVQRNVKRMLAYSSINHAGFILLGVQAATARGVSASLYYLFAYAFMVLGSFAIVGIVGNDAEPGGQDLDRFRGLGRRHPTLAVSFAILLLAQAGAPFTTGFFAKFYVVEAAAEAHSYGLAVIAMLSAAIAAFFYLRLVFVMFGEPAPVAVPVPVTIPTATGGALAVAVAPAPVEAVSSTLSGLSPWVMSGIGLCVATTVVFGIWPQPLLDFAHQATLVF